MKTPSSVTSRAAVDSPAGTFRVRGRPRPLTVIAVLGGAAVLTALWLWGEGVEHRGIRHLPQAERSALYDRTLRSLEAPCSLANRPGELERFCREQAEFVLKFPECDAACSALARRQLGVPTR